jgi:hypothetical protein
MKLSHFFYLTSAITLSACDSVGPEVQRLSQEEEPDYAPPVVSFTSPENSDVIDADAGTMTVSVTATDDVGVSMVRFYLDGQYITDTVTRSGSVFKTMIDPVRDNQIHTLGVQAFDYAEKSDFDEVSVRFATLERTQWNVSSVYDDRGQASGPVSGIRIYFWKDAKIQMETVDGFVDGNFSVDVGAQRLNVVFANGVLYSFDCVFNLEHEYQMTLVMSAETFNTLFGMSLTGTVIVGFRGEMLPPSNN